MTYILYASTDTEDVEIVKITDLDFIKRLTDCFTTGRNIRKFTVISLDENNQKQLVYTKELRPIQKGYTYVKKNDLRQAND